MTKVMLDACVLYPPLVRSLILSFAQAGAFEPVRTARILEEWRRAVAAKQGPAELRAAEDAILKMAGAFPEAEVAYSPDLAETLELPDRDDRHVLAASIESGAETLVTFNLKDFPTRTLSRYNLQARHPDSLLWEHFSHAPDRYGAVVASVLNAFDVPPDRTRAALKRARLPRLGKAVEAGSFDINQP